MPLPRIDPEDQCAELESELEEVKHQLAMALQKIEERDDIITDFCREEEERRAAWGITADPEVVNRGIHRFRYITEAFPAIEL